MNAQRVLILGFVTVLLGSSVFGQKEDRSIFKQPEVGIINTIAGGSRRAVEPGTSAREAFLSQVSDVAADAKGNLFIVGHITNQVWRVDPQGIITVVAGTGQPNSDGDGGPAVEAGLHGPNSLALDGEVLYISEQFGQRIRRVDETGIIRTVAGGGEQDADGIPATEASLNLPVGIAVQGGELYFTEFGGNRVRKVDRNGMINTIAGTGNRESSGDDGPATRAALDGPVGVAIDSQGRVFVSEIFSGRIRQIDERGIKRGIITSLNVRLTGPAGLAIAGGSLFAADYYGNRVLSINLEDGAEQTVAAVDSPYGITTDSAGNVLVTLNNQGVVCRVDAQGRIIEIAGKPISEQDIGDRGPATRAVLNGVAGAAADESGNLFIAEASGNRIRRVTPDGIITTVAGTGVAGSAGDGGPATQAQLNYPVGLIASGRDLFILEAFGNRIRRIDERGQITTVAGRGIPGFAGDGGPAVNALLNHPQYGSIFKGQLYFADTENNRVRKIDEGGIITTIAGSGEPASSGDGGPAIRAGLNKPRGVAIDEQGILYISESDGHRVRRINANGMITTFAGTGREGFSGVGGLATQAELNAPFGLAVDGRDLYIADSFNNIVWKVDAEGIITVAAGGAGTGTPVRDGVPAPGSGVNCVVALGFQNLINPAGGISTSLLISELDGGLRSVRLR